MRCRFLIYLSCFILAGCAHHVSRSGIISKELPLTLDDLSEIRAGEKNYQRVLWDYRLYESPQLEKYANAVAANIAAVSTRPNLPYHVVLLDSEEINMFGGPGGYIFITRGFFGFIESEAELAGAIAHEISHVANYEYSNVPHLSKVKLVYGALLKGSEFAKSSIGSYGTAANVGLKGLGAVAPRMAQHFSKDQEVLADERAVDYLTKAGYDPRAYLAFLERLSKVDMQNVSRFVVFFNTHPPFAERRQALNMRIAGLTLKDQKIEQKDLLSEIRQETANAPDSIIFKPDLGIREVPAPVIGQVNQTKQEDLAPQKRRWAWF